jgi:hypothetical protein
MYAQLAGNHCILPVRRLSGIHSEGATDMDYAALAARFWEEGYIVLENFFDAPLMDHVNQLIVDHFGMSPEWYHTSEFLQKSKAEVIPWFPQREGVTDLQPIDEDPRLARLTAAIIGEEWQEQYCMVLFSRQGSIGQAWHQDCPPEDSSLFNLNRLVYTHSIDDSIGGQTVVIPGTHRRGLIPAGDPTAPMDGQLILSPTKGTLVILHGHTWHRVLPVHGTYRVSTNFRAVPKGTPENVTDICVYRNMRYQFSTGQILEERVPPTGVFDAHSH